MTEKGERLKKVDIRHIFCDLDGTLFGQSLKISPRVRRAVNSLPEDIGFSMSTARAQSEAFPLLGGLRLKGPQILENGATIIDEDKKILKQFLLEEYTVKSIVEYLNRYDIWRKIVSQGNMFDFGEKVDLSLVSKIALQDLTPEMHEEISVFLKDFPNIYFSKSHAAHKPGFLTMDISNSQSTKLEAVNFVLQRCNLERGFVMGIGDSYNDYPLLMATGFKVAMGNAVKELKDIADFVTPSVQEDGVAVAIEKFILFQ